MNGTLMHIRRNVVVILTALSAIGALAKPSAQQPAATPAKPPTFPAINSEIGKPYPIDELEHTLTYTLESVAVASRFASAERNVVAGAGKRLLVLTSSVTNIQSFVYPLGSGDIAVNVFAPSGDRSLSGEHSFILPGLTSYPTNVKPKDKLRFVTVMEIHGQGPIKQLAVVKGSRSTRRAWYDVQKDLGTIASVFADGSELRDRAETTIGKTFDLGPFDMTVESAGPVASAGSYRSSASSQVYAVTLKVINTLRAPEKFGWQYGKPVLVDAAGQELRWSSDLIDTATGQTVSGELPAGTPYVVQYAFSAEPGRTLKTFTLAMNGGRTIVVNLR